MQLTRKKKQLIKTMERESSLVKVSEMSLHHWYFRIFGFHPPGVVLPFPIYKFKLTPETRVENNYMADLIFTSST